jgi:hypothetical protein
LAAAVAKWDAQWRGGMVVSERVDDMSVDEILPPPAIKSCVHQSGVRPGLLMGVA